MLIDQINFNLRYCTHLYRVYDTFQNYHRIYGSPVHDYNTTIIGYLKLIKYVPSTINRESKLNRSIIHMNNNNYATISANTLNINRFRELKEIDSHFIKRTTKNTKKYSLNRRKSELRKNFPLSRWEKILIRQKILREESFTSAEESKEEDTTQSQSKSDTTTTTTTTVMTTMEETDISASIEVTNKPPTIPTTTRTTRTTTRRRKKRRRPLPKDEKPRYHVNRPYS